MQAADGSDFAALWRATPRDGQRAQAATLSPPIPARASARSRRRLAYTTQP